MKKMVMYEKMELCLVVHNPLTYAVSSVIIQDVPKL